MGSPPPGVPPGDEAQDGAIRILGVIKVLSDNRRFGKAFETRKKFRSGDEGDPPKNQPLNMEPVYSYGKLLLSVSGFKRCTHCHVAW